MTTSRLQISPAFMVSVLRPIEQWILHRGVVARLGPHAARLVLAAEQRAALGVEVLGAGPLAARLHRTHGALALTPHRASRPCAPTPRAGRIPAPRCRCARCRRWRKPGR